MSPLRFLSDFRAMKNSFLRENGEKTKNKVMRKEREYVQRKRKKRKVNRERNRSKKRKKKKKEKKCRKEEMKFLVESQVCIPRRPGNGVE